MKMRVTLVIDLDEKLWAEYQGLNFNTQAAVREDVKGHVLNMIQGSVFLEEAKAQISLG